MCTKIDNSTGAQDASDYIKNRQRKCLAQSVNLQHWPGPINGVSAAPFPGNINSVIAAAIANIKETWDLTVESSGDGSETEMILTLDSGTNLEMEDIWVDKNIVVSTETESSMSMIDFFEDIESRIAAIAQQRT
jgi:hypothetical protein